MVERRTRLASILVILAVAACGPGPNTNPSSTLPPGSDIPRLPTQPGSPVGRPSVALIGAAGGSFATPDGAIRVTVPPGSIQTDTEFSITPIGNTARGAVAGAYRLAPEGSTFPVPVTLTFKAPESYPKGASIVGVGVEYQDRRGYWHRVEPVIRDAAARTVTVQTTHFSDWALTWQTGTPSAEGPIKLTQTVGIPFTAFGRATVFLLNDDPNDTSYLLTGTLTVPDRITIRDEVCVPDQVTKTLPLSIAEIHKGSPAVFRWGIGAHWSLSCTAPGGAVTTRLMPAMFDTMFISLTRCGGYYEAGQVAQGDQMSGTYTSNCGAEGIVSATWDLRACVPDQPCQADGVCRAGITVCSEGGVQSCVDAGIAPNRTACGTNDTLVCSEGQCVDLADQAIGVTLTPDTGLITTEKGGTATFEVVLNKQPTTDVTIPLSSSDPAEGTVSPASVVFTPSNWDQPQTVTITGQDEPVVDGDKDYTIVTGALVSADPRYENLQIPDVGVQNLDDDVASFVVDPAAGLVTTESGGAATFTIALTSRPAAEVRVDLSSSATSEGTVAPISVTFDATNWNVPQTVTVRGVDDLVADGDVEWTVLGFGSSSDPNYQGRAMEPARVTNADNDVAGIIVSPSSGVRTAEPNVAATFTVALRSQPTADVTIPLVSLDTAEGVVTPVSVTFTPFDWNVPQTVTVTGVDDLVADGPRTWVVSIGPAASLDTTYGGMDPPDLEVTNDDDDVAGVTVSTSSGLVTSEAGGQPAGFSVVLTSQPTANVVVPLTVSDPTEGAVSPSSLTFTTADWNVPQPVSVSGVDDAMVDGVQAYTVQTGTIVSDDLTYAGIDPSDVSALNLDDDVAGIDVSPTLGLETNEAGGTATFQVVLRSQPAADVIVPLSSSNPNEGTPAPASLTFTPANWNVPQQVTVTGVNDWVVDGLRPYSIQTGPTQSGDPDYDARDPADVALTNADNDTAGISVSTSGGLVTTEAGGGATFTVVLTSQPTGDVTIPISVSDATEGSVSPAALTFTAANWNVEQTITVVGVDDLVQDGPQPYFVVIGAAASSDSNYAARDAADVSVSNSDNDVAGISVGPTSGLVTSEARASAAFWIALDSQPTADVRIALRSSDTTEGAVAPAEVTFTPSNWNVAQVVTVTGVNDDVADGAQPYTVITDPAVSGDPAYSGRNAADVSLSNADDDFPGIAVLPVSGLQTFEAGGSASFSVVLLSAPTHDVTFDLSSSDLTEGVVSATSLTFTPADWNQAQVVTVTGVDDAVDDGDVPYTVVTSAARSQDPTYEAWDVADVDVINVDDDTAGVWLSRTSGLLTTESGASDTFDVALTSEPALDVTILLESSSPEGTVSPSSVTFTSGNWRVAQTVTVTGQDDALLDGDQPYWVVTTMSTSDPRYGAVDVPDVAVTNADNEPIAVGP